MTTARTLLLLATAQMLLLASAIVYAGLDGLETEETPVFVVTDLQSFSARQDIKRYLASEIENAGYTRVAEFGPGGVARRFPSANILIDHFTEHMADIPESITTYHIDIDTDQVPVDDNAFDFVYSRHMMEDINNPVGAFREMTRLARRGYIETPSPLIESTIMENVSGGVPGYSHHRFLFWTETATNTLYAIQKFPMINTLRRPASQIHQWHQILNDYPPMFNNYYQWDIDAGMMPKIVMLKHSVEFSIEIPRTYGNVIDHGIQVSINHTIDFFNQCINPFVVSEQTL